MLTMSLGVFMTSCRYQEPQISFQSVPNFYRRWELLEETATCNQGSVYNSRFDAKAVELRTVLNDTYEFNVEGESLQTGTFVALTDEVRFNPAVFPNDVRGFSSYQLTGPRLILTTIEQLDPNSPETCEVRRVFRFNR